MIGEAREGKIVFSKSFLILRRGGTRVARGGSRARLEGRLGDGRRKRTRGGECVCKMGAVSASESENKGQRWRTMDGEDIEQRVDNQRSGREEETKEKGRDCYSL